ncbi:MAG: hypothetical protein EXR68_01405 [Dehalococcoidia bacterium]|nr:hypothetical protein [Dehalococcoidia bacterium]
MGAIIIVLGLLAVVLAGLADLLGLLAVGVAVGEAGGGLFFLATIGLVVFGVWFAAGWRPGGGRCWAWYSCCACCASAGWRTRSPRTCAARVRPRRRIQLR